MVGQYDRFLYAMFDVTDNKVLLRPTNSLRIDKNDHLQIAMTDQNGLFQTLYHCTVTRRLGECIFVKR